MGGMAGAASCEARAGYHCALTIGEQMRVPIGVNKISFRLYLGRGRSVNEGVYRAAHCRWRGAVVTAAV